MQRVTEEDGSGLPGHRQACMITHRDTCMHTHKKIHFKYRSQKLQVKCRARHSLQATVKFTTEQELGKVQPELYSLHPRGVPSWVMSVLCPRDRVLLGAGKWR